MDALPISENKGEKESVSCVPGVMHACGHDAHMAVLLGAAGALSSIKDKLPGTVKLLFQPSEEKRESGAKLMIEDGALKDPPPGRSCGSSLLPGAKSRYGGSLQGCNDGFG